MPSENGPGLYSLNTLWQARDYCGVRRKIDVASFILLIHALPNMDEESHETRSRIWKEHGARRKPFAELRFFFVHFENIIERSRYLFSHFI